MHRFTLHGICVMTVMFVMATFVPFAACHNRPGEAPERVCYHSNNHRAAQGGYCGGSLPVAVRTACDMPRGKRSANPFGQLTKGLNIDLSKAGLEPRTAGPLDPKAERLPLDHDATRRSKNAD
ncbi:hypothetical protein ElyMa_004979700 [Elysia marginata]|uniref:Uncharacterized protein n=1 Tax=Elysia marginata TaxID=1093978 RepID=A0AAV4J3E8_9GAST|nr:hypothetical protein ElyMa_004979700 [Elysia marginata]